VESCPCCAGHHQYVLGIGHRELMFGGPAREKASLVCPTTGRPISVSLDLGEGEYFAREVDPSTAGRGSTAESVDARSTAEDPRRSEWRKTSRGTALDFCRTMLTTSTGAVAVYFAVLKYIGTERIDETFQGKFGLVPPILFLIAAVIYVAALRPTLGAIGTDKEFEQLHNRRLRTLAVLLNIGTAVFLLAVGLAIYIFFYALGTA
jgi:hypothetical protein